MEMESTGVESYAIQAEDLYDDLLAYAVCGMSREMLLRVETKRQTAIWMATQYRILLEPNEPRHALHPREVCSQPPDPATQLPDAVSILSCGGGSRALARLNEEQRKFVDAQAFIYAERKVAVLTLMGLSDHRNNDAQVPVHFIRGARRGARRDSPVVPDGTHLYCDRLHLSFLREHVFSHLTHMTSLSLANNQLTALPDSLAKLLHLKELDISNNQMTELPDVIRRITGLRGLYVYGNILEILPEWIGDLNELDCLSVHRNRLCRVPRSLARLTQLKRLNLGPNPLEERELDWIQHQLVPALPHCEKPYFYR